MNWGTKLTIGMVLFMGFIITLVILMIKPHKADSLIEDDYYEKGQTYDLDYNARRDAQNDKMLPIIQPGAEAISITFPKPVSYTITFRRLADSRFDKSYQSDSTRAHINIPNADLPSGSWLLRIEYKGEERNYLYQDKILMP
ncbi:MAG: FixH family protein [Daejeonella sp.]|uniref:FixH family protein n=1 Tax=Daejeonella sp. TaxID=2805397 RepID=UPI003C73F5E0